jgi:hypothetical protein
MKIVPQQIDVLTDAIDKTTSVCLVVVTAASRRVGRLSSVEQL